MLSNSDGTGVGSRVHAILAPASVMANTTHLYFVAFGKHLMRVPL
jgi:hypothetical protein